MPNLSSLSKARPDQDASKIALAEVPKRPYNVAIGQARDQRGAPLLRHLAGGYAVQTLIHRQNFCILYKPFSIISANFYGKNC